MMKNWQSTLVSPDTPILKTIEVINQSALQVAMVVDKDRKLLGMVTDGDIRRAILDNHAMSTSVEKIMKVGCTVASIDKSHEDVLRLMKEFSLRHIPIVDHYGRVIDLKVLLDIVGQPQKRENWVVLMAGGLGSRLLPLTEECPKPLLKVGGRPLLETIIENFKENEFYQFFISLNYKGEMIEEYFGDGSKFGVKIKYIREEKKLGTVGALHMLTDLPPQPIFVMNGDVLTKINLQQVLNFHLEQKATATMCVREYDFQVPFGVVKVEGNQILEIEEKPVHNFFVNAGIYVLEPSCLKNIPENRCFNMTDLFEKLIRLNEKTVAFPIHEYWLDVGQLTDFRKANGEFQKIFK